MSTYLEIYPALRATIAKLTKEFDTIPADRKNILRQLADFLEARIPKKLKIELIFICTHNSRRSHIAQIWAQTAAAYFNIPDVTSYSGGTEATAFNPRAVKAMQTVGFDIRQRTAADNPQYEVSFSDRGPMVIAFSKKYDADTNPQNGFAAVMTCSHADDNCPVVQGMDKRISLPYDDPKDFDGTAQEGEKYLERVNIIGRELLYAFSLIRL